MAFRDIAGDIARHLDLPLVGVPGRTPGAHFGWPGALAAPGIPAPAPPPGNSWGGGPCIQG